MPSVEKEPKRILNRVLSPPAAGGAASADDYSSVAYRWDEDYLNEKYEMLTLKIIHRRRRTGFEECKDIALHVNDLIAGRYQVRSGCKPSSASSGGFTFDLKCVLGL